jgi:8-oxo-dGTP diphosphatase
MKNKQSPAAEKEFLASYDASVYPHPSVSVDVALVTVDEEKLKAVLIRRQEHPALGKWSLPGGFVGMKESLDDAAVRVLETKVGVTGIFLEQLYTFGKPDRDPRTRVITVAYYALVAAGVLSSQQFEDQNARLVALKVPWKGEKGGPVEALEEPCYKR